MLALVGAHPILHVSRIGVKLTGPKCTRKLCYRQKEFLATFRTKTCIIIISAFTIKLWHLPDKKGHNHYQCYQHKTANFPGHTHVTRQCESTVTAGHEEGDTQPDATHYEWLPVWFTYPVRLTPSHAMQRLLLSCHPTTFRNTSQHRHEGTNRPLTWPRYMWHVYCSLPALQGTLLHIQKLLPCKTPTSRKYPSRCYKRTTPTLQGGCFQWQTWLFKNRISRTAKDVIFNPSKSNGYFIYHQIQHEKKNSVACPHSVLMCFVWVSEQTAIISLYSANWSIFVTGDGECLMRGTNWVFTCNWVNFCPSWAKHIHVKTTRL